MFAIGSRVRIQGVVACAVVQMETSTQLLIRIEGREIWLPRQLAVPENDVCHQFFLLHYRPPLTQCLPYAGSFRSDHEHGPLAKPCPS